ncbi:hypothetical protein EJ05DRAFT_138260 [Pseudovirgaria hyperparasitica]|uniref:Thymidylate kinase n=1 Tax=Pseudovirgaria hyperparasitica TaxID=470096 RepID=A0A6A6VW60_9PEZI|nr:uncharacterized protein EJ05DRAFT_138260 [Pseudovirgaria hyperparasitica]KAF2754928.1 hypothetical protein EJ05DRAFT_138260 [Pseudovirgaria hyperparasitica]
MATLQPRQPFASLDSPRLHSLASAKNRQNAVTASLKSGKVTLSPSTKRRCPTQFEDDLDSENIDPSIFNSPSKRSKAYGGTPQKVSKFSLTTVPSSARSAPSQFKSSMARNAVSSPVTANTTPISQSRGSPKHKRVGLLSRRKTGGSPFHRVDPPSFGRKAQSGLPFSLDAALSGSIPTYTPKAAPEPKPIVDEPMPKSWFFEIHEDTAEEEATNMMEHSACVLDISSDDDCETRLQKEAKDRGKENIPPPDFIASVTAASSTRTSSEFNPNTPAQDPFTAKVPAKERFASVDAMNEDRRALGDLPAADYYGPGLDAQSYVIVNAPKPSRLSKEFKDFDFYSPASKKNEPVEKEKKDIPIWTEDAQAEPTPVVTQSRILADELFEEEPAPIEKDFVIV